MIALQDLAKHNSAVDCWIAVHQKVWDATTFLKEHPGGPSVILDCAGTDATAAYDSVHAPDVIEQLGEDKFMGFLEASPALTHDSQTSNNVPWSLEKSCTTSQASSTPSSACVNPPPLETIIAGHDFTLVAERALSPKAWAFYSSAATDLITHTSNKELTRRIMFRPRILRNVTHVHMNRAILGYECKAPFFVSPAAMARMAHPDGELAISRGVSNEGIIQCISTNASFTLKSIVSAAPLTQPFFLQLYVNSDRPKIIALLRTARDLGIKAIFVTVDAPVPGKREADERAAQGEQVHAAISGAQSRKDKKGSGMGRMMGTFIDKALVWEDLEWIRAESSVPIVLKGVQTTEDVRLAVEHGVDGVMLSNHEGRSLDGAQAAILVLLEVRRSYPEAFEKLEVYLDGGFERGSDILKAICLGATAVGIGRPFLYSLCYGQEGVEHLSQILKDEVEVTMRLLGITSLDHATPELLNTLDIDHLVRPASASGRMSKL